MEEDDVYAKHVVLEAAKQRNFGYGNISLDNIVRFLSMLELASLSREQ